MKPDAADIRVDTIEGTPRGRVRVTGSERQDEVEALLSARAVVAVGAGVSPEEYGSLDPLLKVLDAELAASRKVTDKGWLSRDRWVSPAISSIPLSMSRSGSRGSSTIWSAPVAREP